MNYFYEKKGEVFCESVALSKLASEFGTPLYVYSLAALQDHCQQYKTSFDSFPTEICYAVKANDNASILKEIFSLGFGADVVSQGELEKVLKVGLRATQVVYSGVGKSQREIERAVEVGVGVINVESVSELKLIQKVAQSKGRIVSINLRVNPNIDVKTNPYIATGLYQTKFGIADEALDELVPLLQNSSSVVLEGFACHIGSQILELKSFEQASLRILEIVQSFKSKGFPIQRVDMGGGLGIAYREGEVSPPISEYGKVMREHFKSTGLKLYLEPGRSIIGNAGVLLTEVIHTKVNREKHFTIVDAAMNDLIRPSLYDAYHSMGHVKTKNGPDCITDIVGPVCETGDFLGLGRTMVEPIPGDLLFIRSAGAYGFSMASNYNQRPRSAEVVVSDHKFWLIRKRESFETLWQQETL
ncbi:MAG: diaminopimelate decarboxylase [Deltaproteobacteria bacterium]